MCTLFGGFELGLSGQRFSRALCRDAVDFELERVQHDVVSRLADDDRNSHLALKSERFEIRRQANFVALRGYGFGQPVVLNRIGQRRFILVAHRDFLPCV